MQDDDVFLPETLAMERAVAALALEVPGEVWDDVNAKWRDARTALIHEITRLRVALVKLRSCPHACGPAPCPHTRKFEDATRGVLPPRRVTPKHYDELRKV